MASDERIHALDLLRGFALLGILIMNITSFSQVGIAYLNPNIGAGLEGYNKYFHAFNYIFADTRFMSIFSILFGAGILLFTEKAFKKGKKPLLIHYKRMFWLLIFGCIHAYLIWAGDILVAYAICGSLVVLFRKANLRTLYIVSALVFIVPVALNLLTYFGMPEALLESTFDFFDPPPDKIQSEIIGMQGSYLKQMPFRKRQAIELQTTLFFLEIFWRASSMMLIGMILYRKGIITASKPSDYYKKMAFFGLIPALIMSGLGLISAYDSGWNGAYIMNIDSSIKYLASFLMAIAYIGLIMWAYKKAVFKRLQIRLQAAGRMAFTNYIGMSVICTLIFNGHGLGLFETFDRLQQFLFVLGVWALILTISPIILKKYAFGPLEWLWRKLTYFSFNPKNL